MNDHDISIPKWCNPWKIQNIGKQEASVWWSKNVYTMQLIAVKLFPNLVAVPIKSATKIFVGQKDRLRQWDCNITPSPRAA